jgi:uncharacterized membrane protein
VEELNVADAVSSVEPSSSVQTTDPSAVGKKPKGPRLESIDILRGFVMILMALDHSRDFFSLAQMHFSPTDIAATTPAYFITRWITNICAPVFIFLAGVGMSLSSKQDPAKRTFFLITRGVWLLALQVTVMNVFWFFNGDLTQFVRLNVLWAIGWSMIFLAAVAYLPRWAMWLIAVGLICGHNLMDGITPQTFGGFAWVWMFIHTGGVLSPWEGMTLHVLYPIVPWCGVITLGYLMGTWTKSKVPRRGFIFMGLGFFALAVLLRAGNIYGNPTPWTIWPEYWRTAADFVNGLKYPPSFLYLGLCLAPLIVLLGVFLVRRFGLLGRAVATFGQVPFFYYVLHILLLHTMAVIYFKLRFGQCGWLLTDPTPTGLLSWSEAMVPPGIYQPAWDLPQTYIAWLIAPVLLYPLCRWFAQLKTRRNDWWLSYL